MEKSSNMMMEELGGRVASVWAGLRPTTRSMFERALQSPSSAPAVRNANVYDARAEWELSRLLAALDDRVHDQAALSLSLEQTRELGRMAETCALVLHAEARSAEVFAQLFERALGVHDYARVDTLADTLAARLPPSEVCELARHANPAVRALAYETLAQAPTSTLVELLGDPVDMEVAREALAAQADDYGSEEARWLLNALERAGEEEDEL
ncbi:MAG: hypothetical protein DMF64_06500 [Acidobacteria bacterium]|nr:MAG: hypothetical protein DMF64_06500 [Acidobacteriota bacterium]